MNKRAAFILFCVFILSVPSFAADAKKAVKPSPKAAAIHLDQVPLPPLFLAETKGEVYVVFEEVKQKADPPQVLVAGDRVITRANATAYLQFQEGGIVEIGPNSDIKISEAKVRPESFRARFLLAYGKAMAMVKKLTTSSSVFEIEAGGVIAGVRGTILSMEYDGFHCQVRQGTYEGSVVDRWGAQKKERIVRQGEYGTLCPRQEAVGGPLSGADVKEFIRFKNAALGLEGGKAPRLKKLREKFDAQVEENARTRQLIHLIAVGGC